MDSHDLRKEDPGLDGPDYVALVIEWDEDVLDIVEPYFLFFLRCSSFLSNLAKR